MKHQLKNPKENLNYKRKYSYLKKIVKRYVYENAALCDHVFQLQEKLICLKEERNYLLKRTSNYESSSKTPQEQFEQSSHLQKIQQSTTPKAQNVKKKPQETDKAKSRKVTSGNNVKRRSLVPVPVDSSGLPVFPVNLGSLSVHALGEIVTDRLTFHDEDLIYPVGFCSTRVYGSLSDPTSPCIYTCMILDSGTGPLFEIANDTDLETSISGEDINAVHAELLKRINAILGLEVVNTRGRGADFFGISHPTVLNLIQSSPGIRKCVNYKMTKFEVNRTGEPYVEDNDASLTFESLQRSITFTRSHMEDMEDMDEQETMDSTATLRGLLKSSLHDN